MSFIDTKAIYILWLREMKRFLRSKSRIIGQFSMPFFFLAFLGLGLNKISLPGTGNAAFSIFLVPGIVGMSMLFTSMFSGMSVLWDRQFGFLKEIMVAPVKRSSIVLGRMLGGVTPALIQGVTILFLSYLIGFKLVSLASFLISLIFMFLIGLSFIGIGLIFASRMKDIEGFGLVINLVTVPMLFLSGAFFPVTNLPKWLEIFAYINPLFYGIDGLRGSLINISTLTVPLNMLILTLVTFVIIAISTLFFETSNSTSS